MALLRVVVFDDDRTELRYRRGQVVDMLNELVADGVIDLLPGVETVDVVVSTTQRAVAQDLVAEALEDSDGHVLLLADLAAEHNRFRGKVGGRLVRGCAQREGAADRVLRVVWTRQAVVSVVEGLARWVHATASYDPRDWGDLADAITHVVASGGRAPHQVFPAGREVDQWRRDLREAIASLVGEDNIMVGDDLIAINTWNNILPRFTNEALARLEGGRASTQAFLAAVVQHRGLDDTAQAHQEIVDHVGPVAEEHIDDPITAKVVESAHDCLRETLTPLLPTDDADPYLSQARDAIAHLVGADDLHPGDAFAALGLFFLAEKRTIDRTLRTINGARKSADELISAVAAHVGAATQAEAIDAVVAAIGPAAAQHACAVTWLTPAELQLGRAFIEIYAGRTREMNAGGWEARNLELLAIRGRSGHPGDQRWIATLAASGMSFKSDLAYVLWTLRDVRQNL